MEGLDEDIEQNEFGNEEEQEDQQSDWGFGGSEPTPLGGIYGLFKDTLNRKDSLKVSNLQNNELGNWNLTVRDCKRIALISKTFHHPGVAQFFEKQSLIITDSAMSRNGWFTELFVTSKRYAARESSSSVKSSPSPSSSKKSKWKIFSNQESQKPQEE
jgi:hypothetical protein